MNGQLILVKHSLPEIQENLPACEWHLSDVGKLRAARLAETLKPYDIDFVASSAEPKAVETARVVAAKWEADFQVFDGLHEQERSGVPYLSKLEFEKSIRQCFERPGTLVFGGETADHAHERFLKAVTSILANHENKSIVIVSHGTVISLFVSRLTGQPAFPLWSTLGLPGFVVLDVEKKELVALENIL